MARLWGATLVTACMIAAPPPAPVAADAPSSVTITAPTSVKPGGAFSVRSKVNVAGPDEAFVTGGFMDFDGARLAPTKARCPATPAGTFAGDTPQSGRLAPGPTEGTLRARNNVRRTGTLRYCLWVINARTYETEATGSAYIKAFARKKKRRHAKVAAKPLNFTGRTAQHRLPIRFTAADHQIRALTFTAQFHCSDGLTVAWATRLPAFAYGQDGRFNVSPPPIGTINDDITIRGRVKGRGVTGSFFEQYTSVLGNTCKTGTVKFSATAPKR